MRWIIERDVFNYEQYHRMCRHATSRGWGPEIIRIVPFLHEIEGRVPVIDGPAICYGSIGIQKVAKKHDWNPGVFSGDFSTSSYKKLGENFLNHDARVMKLSEVASVALATPAENQFFCKPNNDDKAFAGQTFAAGQFNDWLDKMRSIGYLDENDFDVVVASDKSLAMEYRVVVVGGEVVDMCIYRQWQRVMPEHVWDDDVYCLVKDCMALFNPADVYIVDVAQTMEGLKVIEYNTFNSAGWYVLNVATVMDSVTQFIESNM